MANEHAPFLDRAMAQAEAGRAEGGIPIGSVLVIDGRVVGAGHNRRVQQGSAVLHAEMDCPENAGRRSWPGRRIACWRFVIRRSPTPPLNSERMPSSRLARSMPPAGCRCWWAGPCSTSRR